jgi:hypothetical protein
MITIYKMNAIPKGEDVIKINDVYFNRYTSSLLDDRAKAIIKSVDHSELIDRFSIKSRFDGMLLNTDKLSTGCKTVLNVLYNPDKIFDIRECGDNALDALYSLGEGKICCEYPLISFDVDTVLAKDRTGDRLISSYNELKEWWTDEN